MTVEVYNRCGSCRHFREEFTDRLGRTMGTCLGRPTHPQAGAQEFGCGEYHLDRNRLVPGTVVPDDADLSPRQREMGKRMAAMHARPQPRASSRHEPSRSERSPRAASPQTTSIETTRTRLRDIPLDDEGDSMDRDALKAVLAEVLDETLGLSDAPMHPRYRGGKVIVQPANLELQAKELEIDALFRKVVAIRDKLRVLEQKINGSDKLDSQDKVQIQQYITSCYGSLTSFNFLFRDREDWFVGQG